ncbi:hypothetical protein V5799_029382 [Amblyomma americanum]|uniref:Secreted protein n=1 Tax=Amblyomma americanum TaxID=6943 RepID=A0AAQ4ERE5_AMBAM
MRLTNPFLFFVQAVFFVNVEPTSQGAYYDSPGNWTDHRVSGVISSSECIAKTKVIGLRNWTPLLPAHRTPPSTTSPVTAHKREASARFATSGHGGGVGTMRLTNPFLFFVQAVFFVNVEPTSQGAYYDSPGNWTDHRVSGVISSSECIAKTKVIGLRNWTPLLPAHRTPPSTTSPVTAHKREASARFATSGHGGGVGTMRLTNPFLFFVQAVFFVNVEPTSQGAYYDSPGNWTDHRVSGVISSSECIAKTKVIGLRNWTPLLPAHRTPPSTTSPVTAHKREASARFATSGHGGGVGTMRLTNPFLFFVQAVFFVNVEPTSQGAYYDSPGNWTDHRVSGVISSSECIAKTKVIGLRNWTPLLPAHRTPPSTTSPVTAHKREASARFATSGHGGGVGTMRLTNPFLFFVQEQSTITLTALDVADLEFSTSCARQLINILLQNNTISVLTVGSCVFTYDCVDLLHGFVLYLQKHRSPLKKLNVRTPEASMHALESLVKAIAQTTTLEQLAIDMDIYDDED